MSNNDLDMLCKLEWFKSDILKSCSEGSGKEFVPTSIRVRFKHAMGWSRGVTFFNITRIKNKNDFKIVFIPHRKEVRSAQSLFLHRHYVKRRIPQSTEVKDSVKLFRIPRYSPKHADILLATSDVNHKILMKIGLKLLVSKIY
jgi:hypothetical protein